MLGWADFNRYVAEHGIPEEDYPAALALWIAHQANGVIPLSLSPQVEPRKGGTFRISCRTASPGRC
jgi:hypothetical protein